jgi:3-deoxy-D-manno-octulosonic-acid transferase
VITITTFTPTGSEQVKTLFGQQVQHCYLPLDSIVATTLFLKRLQPKAMVFMETELWPNLIAQCHQQNIKLMLINARLSEKSMRSYRKISWLITPTIAKFDRILAQSQVNQDNYLALGANNEHCQLVGNLKFDISVNADVEAKRVELSSFLPKERKVWLVASTHPGDEKIALAAFEIIKQHDHSILLVIVPRHPERFQQVGQLCEQYGNKLIKRSGKTPVLSDTNVWLLDSLGELLAAYSLADVVTMGGSFSPIGGHNPLEPALFSKPVIVGPNMSNFSEVKTQLDHQQAIVQLHGDNDFSAQLSAKVIHCLTDKAYSAALGENAFEVVKENQGASLKSVMQLKALLPPHFNNSSD